MATASISQTDEPITDGLPAFVSGLPNICGWEQEIQAVTSCHDEKTTPRTDLKLADVSAGFAIALHMHQPMIPAGPTGELINNLQHMFEHPYEDDNYNAGPFAYCYGRIGDFIPELVAQGCHPRVMLDYTGTLLWGLQAMGRTDILDKLKRVTCESRYQLHVEWLGTFWGHAIAESIPLTDIRLQLQAWQHHFAAVFGKEALGRVKGFSLPKMQLPQDTQTLYCLLSELRNCGYQWLLVKESELETLTGEQIQTPHIPHRLVAQNAAGKTAEITVLIQSQQAKTGGVAQMSPYYESRALTESKILIDSRSLKSGARIQLGDNNTEIPPLVMQMDDGENEGRMMNEFPSAFKRAWHEIGSAQKGVVAFNGTEYLDLLLASGICPSDFPRCQRSQSQQSKTTAQTNLVSAHHVPVTTLSQQFHDRIRNDASAKITQQHRYRNALLHNLLLQTSCFRSWGEGEWTRYAEEIYRRGMAILEHDF